MMSEFHKGEERRCVSHRHVPRSRRASLCPWRQHIRDRVLWLTDHRELWEARARETRAAADAENREISAAYFFTPRLPRVSLAGLLRAALLLLRRFRNCARRLHALCKLHALDVPATLARELRQCRGLLCALDRGR